MKTPRTITIVIRDGGFGCFAVHEGERFCDWLCWDEMIAQIAAMTIPEQIVTARTRFAMQDADELVWGRMVKKHNRRIRSTDSWEAGETP